MSRALTLVLRWQHTHIQVLAPPSLTTLFFNRLNIPRTLFFISVNGRSFNVSYVLLWITWLWQSPLGQWEQPCWRDEQATFLVNKLTASLQRSALSALTYMSKLIGIYSQTKKKKKRWMSNSALFTRAPTPASSSRLHQPARTEGGEQWSFAGGAMLWKISWAVATQWKPPPPSPPHTPFPCLSITSCSSSSSASSPPHTPPPASFLSPTSFSSSTISPPQPWRHRDVSQLSQMALFLCVCVCAYESQEVFFLLPWPQMAACQTKRLSKSKTKIHFSSDQTSLCSPSAVISSLTLIFISLNAFKKKFRYAKLFALMSKSVELTAIFSNGSFSDTDLNFPGCQSTLSHQLLPRLSAPNLSTWRRRRHQWPSCKNDSLFSSLSKTFGWHESHFLL